MTSSSTSCRDGERACNVLHKLWSLRFPHRSPSTSLPPKLPQTSLERLSSNTGKTILYLAYGSNLSAETFKGNRGIKPLSAVNVHVPELSLTFDLPGIPYIEPCFANTCYRTPPPASQTAPSSAHIDYHKDRWQKGLIGVVYEVTPEDYRTIIATEGGGASYHDVVVECYPLPKGAKTVDPAPSGATFKAHTLLSPADKDSNGRIPRPDPSYAQASARYLKLITDGGEEHALPDEYMAYLYSLRPYTITTYRQRVGSVLFVGFWFPLILALLSFTKLFADDEGKIPGWLAKATAFLFNMVWLSYDKGFKNVFGDGERTMGDEEDQEAGAERWREKLGMRWCEKRVMLEGS